VLGGVGTYLSTVAPAQLYVAVTTAVTTALISIAEEERLVDKLAVGAYTRPLFSST
jgi:hypothetical protein